MEAMNEHMLHTIHNPKMNAGQNTDEALISEFMKLGCKSKKEAAQVLQIYYELSEVRRYWEVEYFFDIKTEKMYLTAKRKRAAAPTIFLPVPTTEKLSLIELQNFMDSVASDSRSVCLVMINSDSTTIFYELSEGLNLPQESSRKVQENHGEAIDKVLRKHHNEISQSALLGLTLKLPQQNKS
ncbi:uncharacterized protein LOC108733381 [Agrilus planipennis]|uniref:Uncharacterized protein LOC108733381 n=1 Tax=Agrilus planipennis TaxID=224129 RepID=A0A7F5RL58_AGRPL|nr:uncharacterized protein LOC108733381 [Agrilus planipennis]